MARRVRRLKKTTDPSTTPELARLSSGRFAVEVVSPLFDDDEKPSCPWSWVNAYMHGKTTSQRTESFIRETYRRTFPESERTSTELMNLRTIGFLQWLGHVKHGVEARLTSGFFNNLNAAWGVGNFDDAISQSVEARAALREKRKGESKMAAKKTTTKKTVAKKATPKKKTVAKKAPAKKAPAKKKVQKKAAGTHTIPSPKKPAPKNVADKVELVVMNHTEARPGNDINPDTKNRFRKDSNGDVAFKLIKKLATKGTTKTAIREALAEARTEDHKLNPSYFAIVTATHPELFKVYSDGSVKLAK